MDFYADSFGNVDLRCFDETHKIAKRIQARQVIATMGYLLLFIYLIVFFF